MSSRLRIALLALFLVSGAAGLIHEIAWTRVLRHALGGSTLALSTVLIAFLGGLSIGAALVLRYLRTSRAALAAFAVVEAVIGCWALLLPVLVDAGWPLWRALYGSGPTMVFTAVRLVVALAVLAPAAVAMGASLPLLAALVSKGEPARGRWVAGLYGVNALGAAAGGLLAGFYLLPQFGLAVTIRLAAGANLGVALVAFLAARRHPSRTQPVPEGGAWLGARSRALLGVYMVAAAALFVHEIAWARVATLLLGSTVYAFSLLLSVVVAGLALGGALASRFMRTPSTAERWFAIGQGGVAAWGLMLVLVVPRLPVTLTGWFAERAADSGAGLSVVAPVIAGLFLVPSVWMGAAYPLVCRIVLQNDTAGRPAALVQSLGNLAAVVGVIASGWLLLPVLGLRNTLIAAAGLSALAAIGALALDTSRGLRRSVWVLGPLWIAAAAALPVWDAAAVSLGPFVQARRQPLEVATSPEALRRVSSGQRILFHRDGREASWTVKETPDGERSLWINGKPDASSVSDLATQRLLAHIPLLLNTEARRVLIVGLASGVTAHSAALHPVESIDIVEVSSEAAEVAAWFAAVNGRVLDDRRVRLIVADGRMHLALTRDVYDVIVSEPSNPWIAGIGDLYTREFFGHVRDRLAPGGVFCLWLPAYHLDDATFRAVGATFVEAFPSATLWHTQGSDYLWVGSAAELDVDAEGLQGRMREALIRVELADLAIDGPSSLFANLVLDPPAAREYASAEARNTDDNGLLEFAAPRRLLANPEEGEVLMGIERSRGDFLAFLTPSPAWGEEARVYRRARGSAIRASLSFSAGRADEGFAALREAAALNAEDPFVEQTLAANQRHADNLAAAGRREEAVARYRMLLELAPDRVATRSGLDRLLRDGAP